MTEADVIQPSASIASTGPSIRYIGKDHCYAFSGAFVTSASDQTLFDFTTGSGYIVATLTMTAPIDMVSANLGSGYIRGYQLDFNGQTVGLWKVESGQEDMPSDTEAQILIPPLTAVVLTCVDSGSNNSFLGTANITGRVYGAE